jgi:hypothetical protein
MRLYGKVVNRENVRYTETSGARACHLLRIYKSETADK